MVMLIPSGAATDSNYSLGPAGTIDQDGGNSTWRWLTHIGLKVKFSKNQFEA
jgi:hypothetical protein